MTQILVTPEQLLAQSAEMAAIKNEFDGLQQQLSNTLVQMNGAWSPNMSNNFSPKITSAQKSFMSVLNMLENGSNAARIASNTFDGNINGVMEMMTGDSALSSWINTNAETVSDSTLDWIGEQIAAGKTPEEIMQTVESVDVGLKISDIMKEIFPDQTSNNNRNIDWGIDTIAEIVGKVTDKVKWVDGLGLLTGGTLSSGSLIKNYAKNMGHALVDNGTDIINSLKAGDYGAALNSGLKAGWELSAGSLLKTGGDAAVEVVKKYLPDTYKWYEDRGATDAEGIVGVINGSIYEMITGDKAGAKRVQNYYSDHGGIAQGVIDGFSEIGSYAAGKIGDFFETIF